MSARYFGFDRAEMTPFIPAGCQRVLEIGCGSGKFRQHFNDTIEYWGVELNTEAANEAAETLSRVINGDMESAFTQLPERYFDLIVCNDVIEHLPDTDEFLRKIKTVMATNAMLMGSIPNVRYFANLYEILVLKDWRYRDAGIMDRTHLRFFTEKSLHRTFIENNFDVDMFAGVSGVRPKQWYKQLLLKCIELVLGRDSRDAQFGFRIRLQ